MDYIIRIASVSFGRWYAPHRKRFLDILNGGQVKKRVFTCFLTALLASKCFFLPSLPINRLQNFTISHTNISHPLLLFLLQPCVSIVGLSSKETSLKIFRDGTALQRSAVHLGGHVG